MTDRNSTRESDFAQEIEDLESETDRVSALTGTTDAERADLVDRLRRIKTLAGGTTDSQ